MDSWVRKICWRRDRLPAPVFSGFPHGSAGKESACNAGDLGLIPGLGRSPGEEKVFWPREFHGLYSPWTQKESDKTERFSLHLALYDSTLHTKCVGFEGQTIKKLSEFLKAPAFLLGIPDPLQNIGVGSLSLLQGIFPTQGSNPGLQPRSPALQADSLPAEPQEKPKSTGKGSLSLLQWIFPTQELNQSLLHCRWILYQLS